MATLAGAHAERVGKVRELLTPKGRREQRRFAFEGPTLLEEALRSNVAVEELYVTERILASNDLVEKLDRSGTSVYIVDERTMHKISDVETPTEIIAVAAIRMAPLDMMLAKPLTLVLADLNDPGNAGTLLRSAEAFGAAGVVFGNGGVDPFNPKVVRGAMGAIFRLELAAGDPSMVASAAAATGTEIVGLDGSGKPIETGAWAARSALVVGHERRGLGVWDTICARRIAIPMTAATESLNAAVAGSIALYEAARRAAERPGG